MIVIVCPFCYPDPNGPKYEQYCKQKLMTHQPFRRVEKLLSDDSYSASYAQFLQSNAAPPSLADDIHFLETAERENQRETSDEVGD